MEMEIVDRGAQDRAIRSVLHHLTQRQLGDQPADIGRCSGWDHYPQVATEDMFAALAAQDCIEKGLPR